MVPDVIASFAAGLCAHEWDEADVLNMTNCKDTKLPTVLKSDQGPVGTDACACSLSQGMYDKVDQLQPLVEGLNRSSRMDVAPAVAIKDAAAAEGKSLRFWHS